MNCAGTQRAKLATSVGAQSAFNLSGIFSGVPSNTEEKENIAGIIKNGANKN